MRKSLTGIMVAAAIALVGYTAMGGAIGAGGLGDLAYRYGYLSYQSDYMLVTVALSTLGGSWKVRTETLPPKGTTPLMCGLPSNVKIATFWYGPTRSAKDDAALISAGMSPEPTTLPDMSTSSSV